MPTDPVPPASVTATAVPDDPPVVIPQPATAARDPRPGASGVATGEIAAWLAGRGAPTWRARQVADHLWSGRSGGFTDLHVLPPALRAELDATWRAWTLGETTTRSADAGLTDKALHRLDDGRTVESVCMRYPARGPRRERATLCISSQAGCAVGCPFCATGELGFARDLETAEIVDQARFWRGRLAEEGRRVTNVVFMGMGEPFLNTDRVLAAAAILSDPDAFGLGARHITISTSGVVPGIERLTQLRPQITLAVSLHAARPALRDLLVPLNRRWSVDAVVAAATAYADATGRRVTYEIVMIDGINDTPADAAATAALLRGRLAHVNLIPMNPVAHTPWRPSPPERIEAFAETLRGAGVDTTIRRNRGTEIGAACGQLAAELAGQPAPATVARRRELLVVRSAAALRADADDVADAAPAEAAP